MTVIILKEAIDWSLSFSICLPNHETSLGSEFCSLSGQLKLYTERYRMVIANINDKILIKERKHITYSFAFFPEVDSFLWNIS